MKCCREAKKLVKYKIELAKATWVNHLAQNIHNMAHNLKSAWEGVKTLQAWLNEHHTSPKEPQFYTKDSKLASSDKKNIEILRNHFEKVYNSEKVFDFSILDELTQQTILDEQNEPITLKEFTTALNKLTLGKAPGLNGMATDALKSLDLDNQH